MNTDTHYIISNEGEGCDFLDGIEPYSSDMVAREGFKVVRVTFGKLMPWREYLVRAQG